jgi:glutamine synthetase
VWRGEQNLLAGGPGPEGAAYIAGLLRDLPALGAVTAPSQGSIARLRPALPTTAEEQEKALTGSPRITEALGPDLLGAFLAVRRSDAAAAHDRALDVVLSDLRWRY